jgi:hypothetical protein
MSREECKRPAMSSGGSRKQQPAVRGDLAGNESQTQAMHPNFGGSVPSNARALEHRQCGSAPCLHLRTVVRSMSARFNRSLNAMKYFARIRRRRCEIAGRSRVEFSGDNAGARVLIHRFCDAIHEMLESDRRKRQEKIRTPISPVSGGRSAVPASAYPSRRISRCRGRGQPTALRLRRCRRAPRRCPRDARRVRAVRYCAAVDSC